MSVEVAEEPRLTSDPDQVAEAAQIAVVGSSKDRGWNGVQAEEVWHRAADFGLPAIADHLLVFHLGRPLRIEERVGGRAGRLGEGSLTILPAGAPTRWHLGEEEVHHLHLYLEAGFVERVADEAGVDPERVEIEPSIGLRDPRFEQIGLGFLSELRSGGLGGRVYAESLGTLLAVQLLRQQASAALPEARRPARLSERALKRVTDYVEDCLGEDVSLAAMAGTVGLSPYHFARLFRESTGLSPHQYVIRRRVERARLLLATTDRSLAAIAAEVGFASGSHLTTHFRRLVGVSPSRFRS